MFIGDFGVEFNDDTEGETDGSEERTVNVRSSFVKLVASRVSTWNNSQGQSAKYFPNP